VTCTVVGDKIKADLYVHVIE